MPGPYLFGAIDIRTRTIAAAGGAIAVVIATMLLIAIAARMTMIFLGGPPPYPMNDTRTAPLDTPTERTDTSILQHTTPFRPRQNPTSQPVAPTTLALTLHGIRQKIDGGGTAIISDTTGTQRRYASGQNIDDNTRIVEIRKDNVLLLRAGRLEILHMPRQDAHSQTKDDQRFNTRAITLDRNTAQRALMQLGLGRAPDRDGKIAVYPPLNEPVFERLGIQRGDIITSVGGVKIDSQTDLAALVDQDTSDRLQINLERQGNKYRLILRMTDDSIR